MSPEPTEKFATTALGELACARLDSGVDIYVEAFSSSEHATNAGHVLLSLQRAKLERLLMLQRACVENDLNMLEVPDWPDAWSLREGGVGRWDTRVDKSAFWFYGMSNQGSENVESRAIGFNDLIVALDVQQVTDRLPDNFKWHGGALLITANDMSDFVDQLEEQYPELEAREHELQMTRVIDASAASSSAPTNSRSAPRAPSHARRVGV